MTDETKPDFVAMLERLDKVERRVDTVERNASDLAKSLGNIVDKLSADEKEAVKKQIEEAVAAEREKQLQKDIATMSASIASLMAMNLGQVKEDVAGIKSDNNRLFWLVLGAVVTGVFGIIFLVFKNGLNI